jgi:hypothetical protein
MRSIILILLAALLPTLVVAQFQEVSVPLSDMSKRGKLVVDIKMGPVKVTGSARKDVLVKYKSEDGEELGFEEARDGLKRISGGFAGIEVSEKNNEVYVTSKSWTKSIVLEIEVPRQMDLKIGAYNAGDIHISNVEGDITLKSFNGDIEAMDISGSLVANTYAGDLKATFKSVKPDTPLSFTTYAGDIDLSFPSTIKANFKMHTEMGEVYTGFDMNLSQPEVKTEKQNGGVMQRTFVDEWITGKVNGGGPEVTMKNFTGDIYIRKN